jgi:hypothetical protein
VDDDYPNHNHPKLSSDYKTPLLEKLLGLGTFGLFFGLALYFTFA